MSDQEMKNSFTHFKIIDQSVDIYKRYERFIPVISFFIGFLWDSLTLTRIDLWLDNLIILTYIFMIGVLIVLINLINDEVIKKSWIVRYNKWYTAALQFFFGGVFSSYVVFYFRSADLSKNWLFLLILLFLFIGNEFIENRLSNFKLQFAMYFFAAFSFFIFFIPVLIKKMNTLVFLIGGTLSLSFVTGLLFLLMKIDRHKTQQELRQTLRILTAIFIGLNIFYFLNWIPPVPLALKEGGIYHHVSRHNSSYQLRFEEGEWFLFWKKSDSEFHYQSGDTVFCFASIFAPTKLSKEIFHRWQYYDSNKDEWLTINRLGYRIVGGRDGGYRGFTYKRNLAPGEWRVDIETEEEQRLSRISFEVLANNGAQRKFKTIFN